jgi:hypothetical protein
VTSPWRAVGGHLKVDAGRLSFEPHGFDRALAGRSWSVPLTAVSSVQVAKRRPFSHLFGAGLRRQLCVEAKSESAYFVVNRVEQLAAELRALVDGA